MSQTLINLEELKLGAIIAEDILVNTNSPIIHKESKVTRELIQVLRAFNITKVPVALENVFNRSEEEIKKLTEDKEVLIQKEEKTIVNTSFVQLYKEAVDSFYKEFVSWEAGMKVDVAKLRNIIMPLVEKAMIEKQVFSLLNMYSMMDKYIAHHSIAVGIISGAIAKKLNFSSGQITQMATAGLMADIGMAKVDPKIREKKSALTESDFSEVKKHTIYSFQMIKDSPLLKPEMKLAIFQHHERLDGSGYPKSDKMNDVSVYAQIIAVADVYHAMTSERIYRAKSSSFKVLEMIREEGFGQFNIEVVNKLIELVGSLPISTSVLLSSGEKGEVVFLHRDSPMRPMIRLSDSGQIIDLAAKRSIHIESVIS
ncbi:HD-GYP domain, c-di-GMP phosphodiesterase class II (or its inactivated variant) [Psychrobacillus sp. OK028]|uniref:HD-GYP domain-containing protein n=1 Tax=Psychrobacillus sp. OK028 TaxID=1884359 RepID=UPI00088A8AD0|nr:HD-GYP domain-containing protein [Psychrobacillus sp. OK028]SDN84570.1 HD-GYP domain, c-di-GMP phosphodiesterase class II (or its inactivated variant) [Psychrobacillus sp. OK028]